MPTNTKRYWSRLKCLADGSFLSFALRTAVLLVTFMVIDRGLAKITRLPEAIYQRPSIFIGHPSGENIGFALGFILTFALLYWRLRGVRMKWDQLSYGHLLRPFTAVLMVALLISFVHTPLRFNPLCSFKVIRSQMDGDKCDWLMR